MARGRLISKSLGSSRKFHALLQAGGKLGEFCQVLFPLIVANTDDWGRMDGDAFTIKNVVLPTSRRPEKDFEQALAVLTEVDLVTRYVVNERIYLEVHDFGAHQPGLHKRTPSKIPESPGTSANYRPNIRESNLRESNLREVKRTAPDGAAHARTADALFDVFWNAYPKKKAKEAARSAWDKRRPTEAFLAAMLAALDTQKQSPDWQKNAGKYIPYPASWLNGARWTDVDDIDVGAVISETLQHNQTTGNAAIRFIQEQEAARGR